MYEVLLVDDDEAIRYLVSRFSCWTNSEFALKDSAENGREAVRLLEKSHYDLVITDIRMPVMDGMALLELMKETYPDVAVVLASTYSDFEYAREGMRLGALDFIPKPIVEKKLLETLNFLLPELKKRKRQKKQGGFLPGSDAGQDAASGLADLSDPMAARISALMEKHLGEGACLDLVAQELGFSRDYVRVLFKNGTGMGLNEYLTAMRMEYAKDLLRHTNLKVYEVAEKAGYGTIDYFTRLFKDYTGETPVRFRKRPE